MKCLVFLVIILPVVFSARILGLFPIPSVSHQVVFRKLTLELARRGHELVIITPNPAFPKDRPKDNVTEIDISFAYDNLRKSFKDGANLMKRGVVLGPEVLIGDQSTKTMLDLFIDILEYPEVKKLTTDNTQHFDLIILEAYTLIITEIFKAPTIWISSLHAYAESYEVMGAVARHPMLYPFVFRENFADLSVLDKIREIKLEYDFYKSTKRTEALEDEALKEHFGPDTPNVSELKKNIDLLLVNSNPLYCNNRPVPPNVVYVGALHLEPLKELPKDLKTYLDDSKNGVIYVSLGTNVMTALMDKELVNAFLTAFKALPYDILWKFDTDLENVPENVKIQKWFPQRDLLVHPKIKLFVTQGGLQSTDEAIDAGVPLVGIPMLGDQYYNVHKYTEHGIGVRLDALTLDAKSLLDGINTVLNDDSYRHNIRQLKVLMNDYPQTPLERAVWWTEYVIRHRGAKHFRSPAANMPWSEYLMADVVITVICFVVLGVVALYLVVRSVVSAIFGMNFKVKRS
ncbi:hypothetical protein ABMA28_010142 [Loxostege sticticalis]|uniref:UDP-glucuronosyltransferase n=1 Tax=Loxostege sticticalis TaxID=481309 RepID=A0ABD0S9W7_LOXSC